MDKNTPYLFKIIGKNAYKKIRGIKYKNISGIELSHPIYNIIKEQHYYSQIKSDIILKGNKLEKSIKLINSQNNKSLEQFLKNHFNHNLYSYDISTVNSAISEIIALAELIKSDFHIFPIPPKKNVKQADFEVEYNNERAHIEVICKHFEESEKTVSKENSYNHKNKNLQIDTQKSVITPFGFPKNNNENDVIQAIHIISQRKNKSTQSNINIPFILWVDLFNGNLGLISNILKTSYPISFYNKNFSSNIIWHALYGWRGCPIFQNFPFNWILE